MRSFFYILFFLTLSFQVYAGNLSDMKKFDTFADDCIITQVISPTRFNAKCEFSGKISVKLDFLTDYASTKGLYAYDQAEILNISPETVLNRYKLGKKFMDSFIGHNICVVTNSKHLLSKNGDVLAITFDEYCNKTMRAQRSINTSLLRNGFVILFNPTPMSGYNMMEKDFLQLIQ